MKEITLTLNRRNLKNLVEGGTISTLGTEERPRVVVKLHPDIVTELKAFQEIMTEVMSALDKVDTEVKDLKPDQKNDDLH
jgi:hypothetical protein